MVARKESEYSKRGVWGDASDVGADVGGVADGGGVEFVEFGSCIQLVAHSRDVAGGVGASGRALASDVTGDSADGGNRARSRGSAAVGVLADNKQACLSAAAGSSPEGS